MEEPVIKLYNADEHLGISFEQWVNQISGMYRIKSITVTAWYKSNRERTNSEAQVVWKAILLIEK